MRFTANHDVANGVENLEKSMKFNEETLGLLLIETGAGRAVFDASESR